MSTSFETQTVDSADQAFQQARAAATPGVVARPWQLPSTFPTSTSPVDPVGFVVACDRADLNEVVANAYATGSGPNAGRLGTVSSAKTALDRVASRERALHARHAMPVRLRAWAAGRRCGHGSLPYGVFGAVAAEIADAAAAATAIDNAQVEE